VTIQVGRQRISEGKLDQFVEEWTTSVVPLREAFGFTFPGAWSLPDSGEFVFVVSHEGDFDEANRAYFESEARKQLTPNPTVHIEDASVSVANVVL